MPAVLELEGVTAGYGKVEVLHDLHLCVPRGSVVALLGSNGAGKTTTLRTISGTLPMRRGRLRLDGKRLDGRSPYEIARAGVVLIPEGRGIFPLLNVRDNLRIAARAAPKAASGEACIEDVFERFPILRERQTQRAGSLSGGEQQMLALSRALLADPKVLLMDELSMGLAPMVVDRLFETVGELKAKGLTIVLVEQYLTYALRMADVCFVMAKGRVVFVGEPAELSSSTALVDAYLGVG
jgi:branched-chain amino acid transport system ATP-binding protein